MHIGFESRNKMMNSLERLTLFLFVNVFFPLFFCEVSFALFPSFFFSLPCCFCHFIEQLLNDGLDLKKKKMKQIVFFFLVIEIWCYIFCSSPRDSTNSRVETKKKQKLERTGLHQHIQSVSLHLHQKIVISRQQKEHEQDQCRRQEQQQQLCCLLGRSITLFFFFFPFIRSAIYQT